MDKKAQLGLETVKVVMLAFLIIAVLAVAIILALTSITDVAEGIDVTKVIVSNSSTVTPISINTTAFTGTTGLRGCQLSISSAQNETHQIALGNISVTACNLSMIEDSNGVGNNSIWFITGSYSFIEERTSDISSNISSGLTDFFSNTGTIFAILVVVVIILAIAIIIAVVSRFGGGGVSGRGEGSGTLMGV